MKDIGEKLKNARLEMGISVEEAAEDLKIRPSQLKLIEEGNRDAFKDVFYLKDFIHDYAKYLGLDYEDIVNEYNEYLFDYTSRLSLEDIKKANEVAKEEELPKVSSPYTTFKHRTINVPKYLIYVLCGLTVAALALIIYMTVFSTSKDEGSIAIYERSNYIELT